MRRATVIGSVALGASLLLAGAPLVASAADTTLYSPDSLAIVGMPYSVSGLDCVSEDSGPASVLVSFNGTTVSPTDVSRIQGLTSNAQTQLTALQGKTANQTADLPHR